MTFPLDGVAALVLVLQGSSATPAQPPAPTPAQPQAPTPAQIEEEVLDNVKRQPLGDGTVGDLALPEDFLRRIADRIVRASYEERYRIVVHDPESSSAPAGGGRWTGWRSPLAISIGALVLACIGWIAHARRKERAAR